MRIRRQNARRDRGRNVFRARCFGHITAGRGEPAFECVCHGSGLSGEIAKYAPDRQSSTKAVSVVTLKPQTLVKYIVKYVIKYVVDKIPNLFKKPLRQASRAFLSVRRF